MSNIDLQYVEAAKRWDAACPEIRRTVALGPAVEPPERKEAYLRHQLDTAGGEILWKGTRAPPVAAEFGLERVIATNDLISFDTLQKAIAVGRFVGMVCR
ncbi:hypothetical protein HN295_20255, partial [Acinetobacter baumannii]|uniref:hypothetical protein n=1 Tax=Acinetobacter baumannii TaxID=470 RepID=UPI00189B3037